MMQRCLISAIDDLFVRGVHKRHLQSGRMTRRVCPVRTRGRVFQMWTSTHFGAKKLWIFWNLWGVSARTRVAEGS